MKRTVDEPSVPTLMCLAFVFGCGGAGTPAAQGGAVDWPRITSKVAVDPVLEAHVGSLLSHLTLEEKVGQMVQAEIQNVTPSDVRRYHLGSVLNGGGSYPRRSKTSSVAEWLALADQFHDASVDTSGGRAAIPLIWGTDAVHGHNNVRGATLFPHNIGLGATRNPQLIQRIGEVTALEVAATGIDWTFAPTLAVVRDDRWGRAYESYSEDPEIVRQFAGRMITGLQGRASSADFLSASHVVATAKHFIGDGGTDRGIDQGDNLSSERQLLDIHAQGYLTALESGVQTVMASFNSWRGEKVHGNRYLLTGILKERLGFDGYVIGDWNGHGQVPGCRNDSCPQAINAGIDMVMVPIDFLRFIEAATAAVQSGAISMTRIDDAVQRILRAKSAVGLFEEMPAPPPLRVVGQDDHRRLAAEAARRSCVLLEDAGVLPIGRDEPIDVGGGAADDIGLQCGGWTVGWQGGSGRTTEGTTFLEALRATHAAEVGYDPAGDFDGQAANRVGIVCIAEEPYAEGPGDREVPLATPAEAELVGRMRQRCERLILVIFSGRPLVIPELISQADVVVAAWLPGTEATQIPGLLTGDYPFEGRLPQPWPATAADLANPDAVAAYPLTHGLQTGRVGQ